jgi:DNA-binding protein HU-beta
MNKTELVSAMAERLGASKKHSEEALTVALDLITEALAEGEKVQLVGFGSFEVRERAPRIGRNPRTKEEVTIPASKAVQFKSGKVLKRAVSQ